MFIKIVKTKNLIHKKRRVKNNIYLKNIGYTKLRTRGPPIAFLSLGSIKEKQKGQNFYLFKDIFI